MKKQLAWLAGFIVLVAGCSDQTTGPAVYTGQNSLVRLTASTGVSSGPIQLSKVNDGWDGGGGAAMSTVESLYVKSATIILKDIAFTGGIDSVNTRDSVSCEREDEWEEHEGRDEDMGFRIHFKGPFVVDMLNGTPTQITLDTIPPGTYNGIRFVVHKLRRKDVTMHPAFPDSLIGFSIVVRGTIRYAGGTDTSFVFKADIDREFKVKGNFVVAQGVNIVPYVLNFDMASWFKGPNGRILDPNSFFDRFGIRQAIVVALGGHMRGGRDRDDNGDPD